MDGTLDDRIKANRRGGGRGGGRGRRGGGDNRTGGGAFRNKRNTQRSNPYRSNRDHVDTDDQWEHDRFDDDEGEEEVVASPVVRSSGGLETGSKLQITNLAFSVNDDDIKDLFEPLGDIKKAVVQYDKSGRSLGTATVVYARRANALDAIKKYNNVPLDGQTMKISLVATAAGTASSSGSSSPTLGGQRSFQKAVNEASRITVSVSNNNRRRPTQRAVGGRRVVTTRGARTGGGGGRGGRGGRGRGGRGGGSGRQVTKEELDAEMDEYNVGGDE